MRISASIVSAAFAAALAANAAAAGRASHCEPAVQAALDGLQIDPADIAGISYQVRTHENRRGDTYVDRLLAWVDLRNCVGRLVVELSPACRVKQAFTIASCAVPGLTAY